MIPGPRNHILEFSKIPQRRGPPRASSRFKELGFNRTVESSKRIIKIFDQIGIYVFLWI